MSTIIELKGAGLSRWLEQKKIQTVSTTAIVFNLPEIGRHKIPPFGEVGLRFVSSKTGSATAIISCNEFEVLRKRGLRGSEREIHIRRDGVGRHNFARGVDISVYTDENLDEYRAETPTEMQFRQDREGWIKTHISGKLSRE